MNLQPPRRRRRPTHRAHLAHRAWTWQPLRTEPGLPPCDLGEEDAFLDDSGAVVLSLRGLLKAMLASNPEALKDRKARARLIRLRERAATLQAAARASAAPHDLGDMLIAGLGGEALRAAHDAGNPLFLNYLDRELATRLE